MLALHLCAQENRHVLPQSLPRVTISGCTHSYHVGTQHRVACFSTGHVWKSRQACYSLNDRAGLMSEVFLFARGSTGERHATASPWKSSVRTIDFHQSYRSKLGAYCQWSLVVSSMPGRVSFVFSPVPHATIWLATSYIRSTLHAVHVLQCLCVASTLNQL